jgi:hypothetical protein
VASLGWLWNGLSIAGEVVTADFRVHAGLMDGSGAIRGPEGLAVGKIAEY